MKKHLSVFLLYVRSTIYPTLLVLLLMAAVEIAGFRMLHCERLPCFGTDVCGILFRTAFLAAFLLVAVICCGFVRKSCQTGYTLQRLRISEFWVFVWHSVSNICMLLLLWMTEIAVLFLLSRQYASGSGGPEETRGLGLFVDFYREEFLHAVLPLQEGILWARNGIFVLTAGIAAAYAALRLRYRKYPGAALWTFALSVWAFPAKLGSGTEGGLVSGIILFFTAVVCVFFAVVTANGGEGRENDDI